MEIPRPLDCAAAVSPSSWCFSASRLLCVFCGVSMAFSTLSQHAINSLKETMGEAQFLTSGDDALWKDSHLLMIQADDPVSNDFGAWLMNPMLPTSLNCDDSACGDPKQVQLPQLPCCEIPRGSTFSCIADCIFTDAGKTARIMHPSQVWVNGFRNPGRPCNFTHIFSGAFNGWFQATSFLEAHSQVPVEQCISVDSDPIVCKYVQKTTGQFLLIRMMS